MDFFFFPGLCFAQVLHIGRLILTGAGLPVVIKRLFLEVPGTIQGAPASLSHGMQNHYRDLSLRLALVVFILTIHPRDKRPQPTLSSLIA